jgi:hypothetical protein
MSSFLIHALIPVLVVLSFGVFRIRSAWAWSPAAWLHDLDFLGWTFAVAFGWQNVHRGLLHNLWLLAIMVGIAWWSYRRHAFATAGGLRAFAEAKPGLLLVPFYYASHLVLDLFAGGVALFWPLTTRTFYWDFEILVDTTKPVPQPVIETQAGTVPIIPQVSEVYLWMTGEEFAILLLYLLGLGLWFLYDRVVRPRRVSAAAAAVPT